MQEPRVKGTMLDGVAASLQIARLDEQVSPAELEKRLSPRALDVLDSNVQIGIWYPVDVYSEMLELYWELEGARDPVFMRAEGERAARELVEHGVYRAFASRGGEAASADAVVRRARVTSKLTEMIYDFVKVDVEHDREAHTLTLVYRHVECFTEAMVHGTHGFLHGLTRILSCAEPCESDEDAWRVERPSAGVIRFVIGLSRLVPRAPVELEGER